MSNGTGNTLSRRTYDCYVCEKQGYPGQRVHLAGKDSNGKTIYLEEDGITVHQHKRKTPSAESAQASPTALSTTADEIIQLLKDIDSKLNRLLAIEGQ